MSDRDEASAMFDAPRRGGEQRAEPGAAASALTVEVAGESLTLHPEGALYWPRAWTLFIADPHFGKDEHFRRAGMPVPAGSLADDLARLDDVLARTGARRLVTLGDLVHARPGADAHWPERIAAWRAEHPALDWLAVAGNHDRGFTPPADWRLDWHRDVVDAAPFALTHEPAAVEGRYGLAGHWHPVARLHTGGERARLPVFAFGEAYGVLPAFASFAGGAPVATDALRCYAIVESTVIALPRPAGTG